MRVLISADMEGATGVTCPADVEPGSPSWQYHRRLFTRDVNAAVGGFLDAGADTVLVNDAHDTKRNLVLDELHEDAQLLIGRHKQLGMMELIDSGVDAVAFVGYHTGAGRQGVLSHTYLGATILGVWLDGVPASEGRLNHCLAAEHGVPLVLVTGDDLTAKDAADYCPQAATAVVKTCIDRYSALCLPPVRTEALIRAAAARGLEARQDVEKPSGPHEMVVEFAAVHPVGAVSSIPAVEPIDERRVRFEMATLTQAMRCFKAVTTLASASTEPGFG